MLVTGGDYGYNPVPGYNESVPMTDQGLPGNADRTPSGARDPRRGPPPAAPGSAARSGALYNGMLAVAALKDSTGCSSCASTPPAPSGT